MNEFEDDCDSRLQGLTCLVGGSVLNNVPVYVGDASSIPGSGRFPGEGNGNPLQYSSLEYPMDEEFGQLESWVPTQLGRT